jgi:hypothetical protein
MIGIKPPADAFAVLAGVFVSLKYLLTPRAIFRRGANSLCLFG